ncbi:MAG: flagellar basal body rod protein FlgC, partial [Rhizobiales bacterium]|nr:flagellar basal body rod protein FlgC [Hyphomicrobiales bacterium]
MDLMNSLKVAASGLRAQSNRMRVIAENLANASSTANTQNGTPYQRQIPTFITEIDRASGARVVRPGSTILDLSDFGSRFDPGHPAANEQGYVATPNVNTMIEAMDMREA